MFPFDLTLDMIICSPITAIGIRVTSIRTLIRLQPHHYNNNHELQ